jgi:hypothetical protein
MEVTSALASKKIKMLEEQKIRLLELENTSKIYIRAEGECTEPPVYDYEATKEELRRIEESIRKIKHAVNVFNTTTFLESVGLYIDEALVEMNMLNRRKETLKAMSNRLPKERVNQVYTRSNPAVEYRYVNYDIDEVKKDFEACCQRIFDIQIALDTANQTMWFEVEV